MKIIWFSEIKWTYLKTRKQQIIGHFPPETDILFIESFTLGKNNQFMPKREGNVTYATVPFFKATPFGLINALQDLRWFRRIVHFVARIWVIRLCRKTGFDTPDRVIATSNIYFADIIASMPKKRTIYDCNDYPLGFTTTLAFAPEYFAKTVRIADVVTTVSSKLKDDIIPHEPKRCDVIGNGVDFDLFQNVPDIVPEEMAAIKKPIVFFSGAIAEWMNTELLERILQTYRDIQMVLLGPIKDPGTGERLRSMSRVYALTLVRERPHAALPQYIRQAKVCMLPFRMNRRIIGANPNTLYEFLACGKPVVTFGFSDEVKSLAPTVRVVDTEDAFVAAIGKALSEPADHEALRTIGRKNSWDSKAAEFYKLLGA